MADATERKAEPTYHVDRLVAEGQDFFGEPPHVVAGALATQTKKNFKLDEVRAAIKQFKTRPVEVDNPVGSNHSDEEADA